MFLKIDKKYFASPMLPEGRFGKTVATEENEQT
jgi:hypothetical protein